MKKLFLISLIVVLAFGFILAGCAEPTPAPTTPAPTTPAPTTPAPTTPAPTTPAPTSPAPTKPGPTTPAAAGPQYGGILRYIVTEAPGGSLGVPENMRGIGAGLVRGPTLESLLTQTNDGRLLPCLAESYEWSNDYKTITLHLRKGVKFHDGTPFNAEAVKWNWDKHAEAHTSGTADVTSTEVVDDYTFRINIKEFKNYWIYRLSDNTGTMISPTAYETNGEDWANWNPVGTGPFKFKSYMQDQSLELERNDDYWGGKPYLDGIKYLIIADVVTAQLAFEAGEGDEIWSAGNDADLAKALAPKGYNIVGGTGNLWALIPSGGKPASPWSNLKVREAAEYAIDKAKIVKSVYGEYAVVSSQMARPDDIPFDPNFKGREYDPDKARQLMAEAGYPDGFKTSLYCMTFFYAKQVDAIQAYFAQVGIDAKLEVVSLGKWIELDTNGWEDGIEFYPVTPGVYGAVIQRHWVKPVEPNWGDQGMWWQTLYRPPELEELCQQYLKIADLEEQKVKGKEFVQFLHDQAIALPLWTHMGIHVLQPYVHPADVDWQNVNSGIGYKITEKAWMSK